MIKVNTVCKYCNKEMISKSIRKEFCSSNCRVYYGRMIKYDTRKFVDLSLSNTERQPTYKLMEFYKAKDVNEGREILSKALHGDLKTDSSLKEDIGTKLPPVGLSKALLAKWRKDNK